MKLAIEKMTHEHWEQVKHIYLEGIETGHATFETEAPGWEGWDSSHLPHSRLVAIDAHNDLLGWAALSPVSSRCVYGGVAEVSVYTGQKHRGKGVGRTLLEALITSSEENGIWTLQAGIFPENEASVELHLKCGFRTVGSRERIGKLRGEWRDTLLLERRSKREGIDADSTSVVAS
jgi:phosphinothricin acetyltransferase